MTLCIHSVQDSVALCMHSVQASVALCSLCTGFRVGMVSCYPPRQLKAVFLTTGTTRVALRKTMPGLSPLFSARDVGFLLLPNTSRVPSLHLHTICDLCAALIFICFFNKIPA